VRAVLDPNVLIAALLSGGGAPAQILSGWLDGKFELVVSGKLLDELERALGYPKLRARVDAADAADFLAILRAGAVVARDPAAVPLRSADPGDDYLLALAEDQRAHLVSGDQHLLALADRFPVSDPRAFLALLA
jgi:putative PIN family toxin of toxin-antitoxin system